MKKRNPFLVLLLSIVTLGIYALYWLYITRKEILQYAENKNAIWPVAYLLAPILAIVIIFPLALLNQGDSPVNKAVQALVFLVGAAAIIGSLVIPFIWFYKYSKTTGEVTKGLEGITLFILLIILSMFAATIVWQVLVQIELNKFVDKQFGGNTPQPEAPAPTQSPTPPSAS